MQQLLLASAPVASDLEPDEAPNPELGRRIAELRKAAGIASQEAAAAKSGVSLRQWHRLEKGLVIHPRRTTLDRVAAALEVELADLVGDVATYGAVEGLHERLDRTEAMNRKLLKDVADLTRLVRLLGAALLPLEGAEDDLRQLLEQTRIEPPDEGEEHGRAA